MTELSRYLFLAGALPLLFLGSVHARETPLSPSERKGLTPSDPALIDSMQKSAVLLTRRTDMWLAWVGFNLSHSLGAIAFGLFVVAIGRSAESYASQAAICVPLATLVAATYVAIGLRYWFRDPNLGLTLALGCFVAAWVTL
jgi:hypothetical protein